MRQETEVLFLVGTLILGFISIFKKSQESSPYEALNSVRTPVQLRQTTMAFSRVSTAYSDMHSYCEMKDEP